MSDFLRSLRSRHTKPGSTSNFDGYYRPPHERRVESDRRVSPRRKKSASDMLEIFEELLPQIENIMFAINENLRTSARINKKRAETEENKTLALKAISDCMTGFLKPAVKDETSGEAGTSGAHDQRISSGQVEPVTAPQSEPMSRETTMAIIRRMRRENMTYSQIAEHLRGRKIPTFSNRGEWHAQTIHRLCSKEGITPDKPSPPDAS